MAQSTDKMMLSQSVLHMIPDSLFILYNADSVALITAVIKALTALVVRLFLSVCWKNGPERGLRLFLLTLKYLYFMQTV